MKKTRISIELDGDTEKIVADLEKLGISPQEAARQALADYAKKAKSAKPKKISRGVGV